MATSVSGTMDGRLLPHVPEAHSGLWRGHPWAQGAEAAEPWPKPQKTQESECSGLLPQREKRVYVFWVPASSSCSYLRKSSAACGSEDQCSIAALPTPAHAPPRPPAVEHRELHADHRITPARQKLCQDFILCQLLAARPAFLRPLALSSFCQVCFFIF